MGQGDVPTSRGGLIRRRREKRQLEHLAASSDWEGAQRAAAAHVKVIEDKTESESNGTGSNGVEPGRAEAVGVEQGRAGSNGAEPVPDGQNGDAEPDEKVPPARTGGFHVHAVPIDQPLHEDSNP